VYYKKQKQNKLLFFGICILLLLFMFSPVAMAENLTSTSFQIENPIIINSGGISSSTSFKHISSTGEIVIGESTATSFVGQLGWLYFPEAVVTPPVDPGGGGGGSGGYFRPGAPFLIPGLACDRFADFNCDNFVNIIDFSILLFYFDEERQELVSIYDLSDDEIVDFLDVSVMFYHWDL